MRNLFLFGLFLAALLGCQQQEPAVSKADIRVHTNSVPINLSAEIARANNERKLLVLQFTGSDWCYGCIRFEKEIFSRPEFQGYMRSNLVFLEVDLPQQPHVPENVMRTNIALAQKFNVDTFPCTIVLDAGGKEIWRNAGFVEGGPDPFIRKLELRRRAVLH